MSNTRFTLSDNRIIIEAVHSTQIALLQAGQSHSQFAKFIGRKCVMIRDMRAAIFDLDGVIVDTAKYHYLAWKRLAKEYRFDFTETDNERLKGVSRVRSLEILLEIGGLTLDESEKERMASRKN
jgi:hypothetical protein